MAACEPAVPSTLAVVGGGWTAVVARVGGRAVDGITLGLVDADGRLAGDVLAGLKGDPQAARQYWRALLDDEIVGSRSYDRVLDELEAMADRHAHLALWGWRIAARIGVSAKPGAWLAWREQEVGSQIAVAALTRFSDCVLVPWVAAGDGRHGAAGAVSDAAWYPPELVSIRPEGWGRNEHPHGERAYERAAYDLAALAETGEWKRRGSRQRRSCG